VLGCPRSRGNILRQGKAVDVTSNEDTYQDLAAGTLVTAHFGLAQCRKSDVELVITTIGCQP
jgi:hypothetical protein